LWKNQETAVEGRLEMKKLIQWFYKVFIESFYDGEEE
jgi:hypothetical protein